MTNFPPRADALGASTLFVPRPGRHRTALPGILATLLLGALVTFGSVQQAEAAQRTHRHATAARHAKVLPQQHRAPQSQSRRVTSVTPAAVAMAAPGSTILSALQRAEAVTGADPALLFAIARRESGFDATARNRRSSARGLMQFTSATWLEVVRDYGHRHGLAPYAAALATVPRGTMPRDARLVAEVLRLRDDPRLAAAMTAERLEGGRGSLERVLGREANAADLYLVHLLGPAGARNFLTQLARAPAQPAVAVVGTAARANRALFIRDRRTLSLLEVYRDVSHSLAVEPSNMATLRTTPLVQIAAAR